MLNTKGSVIFMNNEKKDSDKLEDEVAAMEARIRGIREFMANPHTLHLAHLAASEVEPMADELDDCPTYVANIEAPADAAVNHPLHYTGGNVECIDAIRSSMTDMEYQGYLRGNIFKYLWRFRHKNGTEDLRKARWYLDKLIEAQGVI